MAKTAVSDSGGATGGAVEDAALAMDADLAAVITAWPHLPGGVRAKVMALIAGEGVADS